MHPASRVAFNWSDRLNHDWFELTLFERNTWIMDKICNSRITASGTLSPQYVLPHELGKSRHKDH